MTVTWEAQDGYAGGSRPHEVEIPDEEIQSCESMTEVMNLIDDVVRRDFEQVVYPCCIGDTRAEAEEVWEAREK